MAVFYEISNYIKRDIGLWPFLFGLLVSCKVLGFYVGPMDEISYVLYLLMSLKVLSKASDFDRLSICFLCFLPVTILLGDPNPIFRSWVRLGLFACLFVCSSSIIRSNYVWKFRRGVFNMVLIACTLIATVSFIGYFFGINYMRNTYSGAVLDYFNHHSGTFGGLTNQSMLLGPISGVGVITCLYFAMKKKKSFWILFIACLGSLLFSASRSSLIATIIGCLIFFIYFSKKLGKNIKALFVIAIVATATHSFWGSALIGITEKNKGALYSGLNLTSRQDKWEIRIDEWKSSPLYGIGFCAVSPRDTYSYDGKVEPGSSWLALLSMTGLIGFVLFCLIYIRACMSAFRPHMPEGALIGGLLVMLGVHMTAEGHIFSAGSFLCFLVWLVIGRATDYGQNEQLDYSK